MVLRFGTLTQGFHGTKESNPYHSGSFPNDHSKRFFRQLILTLLSLNIYKIKETTFLIQYDLYSTVGRRFQTRHGANLDVTPRHRLAPFKRHVEAFVMCWRCEVPQQIYETN